MNDVKKDILTIPNLLTFLRILLIPVYAVLYMKAVAMRDYLISAAVLAVSAITDMADGIIARKCKMRSRLGIMLDPFADKLTQGVIMLCLTLRHREILPLLIFFVIKEGFMFVMGCRLLKQKKMLDGALLTGKICTTVLFVSHSMEDVARITDRLVVVSQGTLPYVGTPQEVFSHGAELEKLGLTVPAMNRVFSRIKAAGGAVDASVYTVEQAKAAFLEAYRRKGGV